MYYTKNFSLFVMLILSINFCIGQQTGFAKDERIDTAGKFLKNGYLRLSSNHYITDYAGVNMTQGFLFKDVDLSSYELLAANLSFSDKDQVQKINFQPFKLFHRELPALVTSFKFNIVQKKDISTFGIGIGGDNSLPTSIRGNRLREDLYNNQPVPKAPEVDVSKFDAQRNEINALNVDQSLKNVLLSKVDQEQQAFLNAVFESYEKTVLAPFKKTLDSLLLLYDEKRAQSVFKWTIGYNSQFFSILSAKGKASGFDSLNHFSQKAGVATGTANYSWNRGWLVVSAAYNYIQSRKNAVKGSEKIHYDGYSFSISKRIAKFLPDNELRKFPAYIKSLFIPSINGGLVWELKKTDEQNFQAIEDGIKRQRVITPFIDILIAPAVQFRISLPVQKNVLVDGTKQMSLGATIQYGLKFSTLN